MADGNPDIDAYLKGHGRAHSPFFIIFSDWTPHDFEEVCDCVQNACAEAGISLRDNLPPFSTRNGRASLNVAYRQRIALENLLFGRYNHDGLFSLPHQKDPTIPRPPWFRDYMLIPGPHSIGQKLLRVCFERTKDKVTGRRRKNAEHHEQGEHQTDLLHPQNESGSSADSELTLPTQELAGSANAEDSTPTSEQTCPSGNVSSIELEGKHGDSRPKLIGNLTIHIGTIFELENNQLVMRRTFRDPQSWMKGSAGQSFDFQKVCSSVGVTAGGEKELYFFPDVNKDPHNILDEDELQGGIQCLCTQNASEAKTRSISLFVAADMDHVRALSLDQRGKSTLVIHKRAS